MPLGSGGHRGMEDRSAKGVVEDMMSYLTCPSITALEDESAGQSQVSNPKDTGVFSVQG